MNKKYFKSFIFIAIIGAFAATSCGDDDKAEPKGVEVANAELKAALQQKGFAFDAEGKLLQDEKVLNTTTLYLSGCNLTDASGLDVFPKLTEVNLANNKFGFVFDFSVLPATVTAVDLTGNEIYEYPGLLDIEVQENGDETVTPLREVKKLYLPASARYNCDEIVHLYTANKTADLKMANDAGQLAPYNTLREVPDDNLRAYLQTNFPSMFDKSNAVMINIANRMIDVLEASRNIAPSTALNVENVEGSQYIAMNPSYKGIQVTFASKTGCKLKYLRMPSGFNGLTIRNVSTTYINWSEAKNLFSINILGDNTIERIDFSASEKFGQRGITNDFNVFQYSGIQVGNCPKLKTIEWTRNAVNSLRVYFYNLPLLEELDMSNFKGIGYIALANLPSLKKIVYYVPDGFYLTISRLDPVTSEMIRKDVLRFIITSEIYAHPETKAFLDAYYQDCENSTFAAVLGVDFREIAEYDWTKDYQ
ncbi:MAG: hypothetical protein LBG96_09250 [Tannerella sp.]|jgi:hypothetical protein|nr:hypothetical protein [Tannerella sp.]